MNRGLLALARQLLSPAARKGTITQVSTSYAVAALTFDDGPHPEFTARLLRVLERHQARATFFMVGEAASRQPDLVRRVAQAGHAIGNHSWDHPSFPLLSRRERRKQLRDCQAALAPWGQRLFRPPFGHQTGASRFDAWCMGFEVVTWSIASEDWLARDAQWMVERVASEIKAGSVILFHDSLYALEETSNPDREPTLDAVNRLLELLSQRFRFVTLPELFECGQAQREMWWQQGDLERLARLREAGGEVWRHAPARMAGLGPTTDEKTLSRGKR